jgi:hypothetical protein
VHEGFRVISKSLRLFLLSTALILLSGCNRQIPHTRVYDFGDQRARLVAVLPVEIVESDAGSAALLRVKLVEELHFKGYPEIPLKWIDERLAALTVNDGKRDWSPQSLGKILNVDAVLYTTLKEGRMSVAFLHSRIVVDAEFEMKSARTGESLWRAHHRVIHRNYGLSRKSLELKSSRFFEPAMQEVLRRVLETLPDGPDAVGA